MKLTKQQKSVLKLARELRCRVFYDSPRHTATRNENRYIRIKGHRAHGPAFVHAINKAFPDSKIRLYWARHTLDFMFPTNSEAPVPAISIRRDECKS